MFTSSMPNLAKALAGVLPEGAVRQLTQGLGNCVQPLTHRGPVNIEPAAQVRNTAGPGATAGGTWNPFAYQDILPKKGDDPEPDPEPSKSNIFSFYNSFNYGGGNFYFPTSQEFLLNQYYGGPTFHVGGDSYFHTQRADNSYITNLTVAYINGKRVEDPPDPQPGVSGSFFNFVNVNGQRGRDGRDGRDAKGPARRTREITYLTRAWFDPEACEVRTEKRTARVLVAD